MRHAAGQLADGLHFLRLAELFLQFPAFGDVAEKSRFSRNVFPPCPDRRGIAVQDPSIRQLDFIAADFIRMGIEIRDPLDKLLWDAWSAPSHGGA